MNDPPRSSSALFYSDPSRRVLMLSARPPAQANSVQWMIFPERLFTWPWIRGQSVAWNDWSQYAIVRNTSVTRVVGKPAIVGTRVLYLDQDSSGTKMRINSIAFMPHSATAETAQNMWDFVGKHTPLVPSEARREIPAVNGMGCKLQDLRATEDNIVLLYVSFVYLVVEQELTLVSRKVPMVRRRSRSSPLVPPAPLDTRHTRHHCYNHVTSFPLLMPIFSVLCSFA